jgi:hypothetical protein
VAHERAEDLLEHARALPFLKATMTRRPRTKLLRQRLPLAARPKPIQDSSEDQSVIDARATAVRFRSLGGDQPLHQAPQIIRNILEVVAIHEDCRSHPTFTFNRF